MRIISGTLKGKRIQAPKNLPVRPTTDMAKEALFNILNNRFYLDQLSVLDLFAGIGSISLELASRGCTDITAVDRNRGCVKFLDKTSTELNLDLRLVQKDAFSFLEQNKLDYDLIFADPPYDMEVKDFERLIDLVRKNKALRPEGIFVMEHGTQKDFSDQAGFLESRKYGSSVFSFFDFD